MVPNLTKGTGIKGTALYVLHDVRDQGERTIGAVRAPEQQSQHRVGFTTTRNLSTDDPELGWRLMCATAKSQAALKQAAGVRAGGRPSKYQCGHIALSWEHQTQPDAAEMTRAAEGALQALGWEKLQALIVEHKEKDHSHVHIVVNLVDPETGRNAPNSKNEYERLQRWAHEYDKARGIEVCPDRAARMERAPDDPQPPAVAKRWLSRKEYEAVRGAERAEHKAAALARYREAAAIVREEFRPEWAQLHREQRAELIAMERQQQATMRALDNAANIRSQRVADPAGIGFLGSNVSVRSRMVEFSNEHRAEIWRGIDPAHGPVSQDDMLRASFVKAALERAHAADRATMLERHSEATAELQGRHTEARQDAYRQTWKTPEPAQEGPVKPESIKQEPATPEPAGKITGRAAAGIAAAAVAAGVAYAVTRKGPEAARSRDPEQDLAKAAERISRQQTRAANANDIARVLKAEEPDADRRAAILARMERQQKARQPGRDPTLDYGRERTRERD